MKKSVLMIISIFISILSFLISNENVYAKNYEISLIPYHVSNACDLDQEDGEYLCFEEYLEGNLETYRISDSQVEPGETIMLIVQISADEKSELTSYNVQVNTDSTFLTYHPNLVAVGLDSDYGLDYGFYPSRKSGSKYKTTWTVDPATLINGGKDVQMNGESGSDFMPLVTDVPIYALFYNVNSNATPGTSFTTYINRLKENTNASNATSKDLTPELIHNDLTLSILSNVSGDGTLSELKAEGNNGKEYTFEFVPSNKNKVDYEFIVPNAVTSITFTGKPTDPIVTITTGLDTPHSLDVGDNEVLITVQAQSGEVTVYRIKVHRLSSDATLSSITTTNNVDFGTISALVETYEATVPYKTKKTDVTATPTHELASIKSGEGEWLFQTDNNTNYVSTFTITIEAEDCQYDTTTVPGNVCTSKEYTFNVTRTAPSKDVTLKDLKTDATGTLQTVPGFSSSIETYTLDPVPNSKTTLNIEATLNDTKSEIVSGTGTKPLSIGDNTFQIVVKGEDGTTTKTYIIKVRRLSSEKQLISLNVTSNSSGNLSPSFQASFTGPYTYTYDSNVTSITISATVKDTGKAKVSIVDVTTGIPETYEKYLNTRQESFGIATETVAVIVTAEDGSTQTYTIKLSRQKSTNNYLSSLTITPGTINETFSATKGSYTAFVEPDVTEVTVNAVLADTNAKLTSIEGNTGFEFGPGNIITVIVTSESGSVNTYTINVTRKKYDIATLDDLKVGFGSDDPTTVTGFDKDTLVYDVKTTADPVPYEITSITIDYVKSNEYATVTGDFGTKSLATGNNTFRITVTSHDGAVTKTYVLNVYRSKNTNNEATGVKVFGQPASKREDGDYEIIVANSYTEVKDTDVEVTLPTGATIIKTASLSLSTTVVNEYTFTVTSETGVVKQYKIYITRTKSNDADIRRVTLTLQDNTTRVCIFNSGETTCTIQVPNNTTGYTLDAVIHAAASITPENGTHYDMPSNQENSIKHHELKVTAEDETEKTYTVIVERAKSDNKYLSSLQTNASGSFASVPNFSQTKTSYSVTVLGATDSITIKAVAADDRSIITSAYYSDEPSNEIEFTVTNLSYGANEIEFTVTSEDGTDLVYTIIVTRKQNTEPRLAMIYINGEEINKYLPNGITFDANPDKGINETSYSYTLNIFDYDMSSITVTAKSMDETYGTYEGTGVKDLNTIYYQTTYQTSTPYENVIVIKAMAHDKTIYKNYTLRVKRKANNSTKITGVAMKYNGANHAAEYDLSEDVYRITVPNSVDVANSENVIVSPEAPLVPSRDAYATVTMSATTLVTNDTTNGNVNTHKFRVIAEDGTPKEYTLIITREKSSDATLKSLKVKDSTGVTSIGTFTPAFESGILVYTVNVPVSTMEFTIEAIPTDPNATVVGASTVIELNESTKQVEIIVTSEDEQQVKKYVLNIIRQSSNDKSLNKIEVADLDGQNYNVEQGSSSTRYKVTVPGDVDKVTVTATPESPLATVEYMNANAGTLNEYSINVGTQVVEFKVKAEDGSSQTYFVEIVREQKTNTSLAYLAYTLQNGEVTYVELISGVYDYIIPDVPYNISSLTIIADTVDPDAVISGQTGVQSIATGPNKFTITVTAQNSAYTQNYTLSVDRAKNSDATLKQLSVNGYTFEESPVDLQNVFRYTLIVDETKTSLLKSEITAVPTDSKATVEMDNDLELATAGTYMYYITVTAEDGKTQQTYIIEVRRPKSTDGRLKSVNLTGATLAPTFEPDVKEYTITVPYGATSFTIEGIPFVDTSIVAGNNTYAYPETTEVILTVTPEDTNAGVTIYRFTVVEAKSTDATLSALSVSGYPFINGTTPGSSTVQFSPTNYQYNIGNIERAVSKVIVNATLTNANGTLKYFYKSQEITECRNMSSCEVTLDTINGTGKIEVNVTAADEIHSKTYTIYYNKVSSTNNFLMTMDVSSNGMPLELNKAFNKAQTSYTLSLPNEIDTVTFALTAEDEQSTIQVNGDTFSSSPKTYTFNNLPTGNTTVTIIVKSESGAQKTYIVTITRANYVGSSDATLEMLYVVDYDITPTFDPNTESYSIGQIPYQLSTLTVIATSNVANSTIRYYVNGVLQTSNVVTIPKESGIITVKVTAEDGKTIKDYTISYDKEANTNADLTNIVIGRATLNPSFNENTYNYTIDLGPDQNTIDLTAITKDPNATIKLNGEVYISNTVKTISNIQSGQTVLTIVVTAEDGKTTKTYKITINKETSGDEPSISEVITSFEYGHTIEDGYIKTVVIDTTGSELKNQLDNPNEYLEIWDAAETTLINDTDKMATGMIVKLIINGVEKDRKVVVIIGDTSGDGAINLFDAVKVLNHYLEIEAITGAYEVAADVSLDDSVNLFDAVKILNHYLDLESIF